MPQLAGMQRGSIANVHAWAKTTDRETQAGLGMKFLILLLFSGDHGSMHVDSLRLQIIETFNSSIQPMETEVITSYFVVGFRKTGVTEKLQKNWGQALHLVIYLL